MNISKTVKYLAKLNKFTEEYNKSVYKDHPVMDICMDIYSNGIISEAIMEGSPTEKLVALGLIATSQKKLPLLNTACMVANRMLFVKRVGFKTAAIADITLTIMSTGVAYTVVKSEET